MSRFAPENFYPSTYLQYLRHPDMLIRLLVLATAIGLIGWYVPTMLYIPLWVTGIVLVFQYVCFRNVFPKRDVTSKTFSEMMDELDAEAEAEKPVSAHTLLVSGGNVLVFDTDAVAMSSTSPNVSVSSSKCDVLNCEVCREYVDGYNCSLSTVEVESESPLQNAWIAERQDEVDVNNKAHTDALASGEESRVATNARVFNTLDCGLLTGKDYAEFGRYNRVIDERNQVIDLSVFVDEPKREVTGGFNVVDGYIVYDTEAPKRKMTLDMVAEAAEAGRARYKANDSQCFEPVVVDQFGKARAFYWNPHEVPLTPRISDALAAAEELLQKMEKPKDPRSPALIALNNAERGLADVRQQLLFPPKGPFPKSPEVLVDGITVYSGADADAFIAELHAEADRLLREEGASERVDAWAESFGPAEEPCGAIDGFKAFWDAHDEAYGKLVQNEFGSGLSEADIAARLDALLDAEAREHAAVAAREAEAQKANEAALEATAAEAHFLNSVLPKANVPNRNGVAYSQEALDQLRPQLLEQYRKMSMVEDFSVPSKSDVSRYAAICLGYTPEKVAEIEAEIEAQLVAKQEAAEDNGYVGLMDYLRVEALFDKGKKKVPACDEVDERPLPRKADEMQTRAMMEVRPVVRKPAVVQAPLPTPKQTNEIIEQALGRSKRGLPKRYDEAGYQVDMFGAPVEDFSAAAERTFNANQRFGEAVEAAIALDEEELARRVIAQGRIGKTLEKENRLSRNGMEPEVPVRTRPDAFGNFRTRPDRLGKAAVIESCFDEAPTPTPLPTPTPGVVLQAPEPKRQVDKVRYLLSGGLPMTLGQLARAAGCSESSVSSRIRDLRLPAFGGETIVKELVKNGRKRAFTYRMVK